MQTVVVTEGPPPWMRWLSIPAAVLIITLVSLAIGSESRSEFSDRIRIETAQREQFNDVDATRIVLATPDGAVELSLDGEQVLGKGSDGDISVLALQPDPDGDVVGFRITEDGTFEAVHVGESTDGATLIRPNANGGFDLVHPDGTTTRLEFDGNGLHAYGADGQEMALEAGPDGTFNLGEGLTAGEADVEFADGTGSRPGTQRPNSSGGNGSGGLDTGFLRTLAIIMAGLVALGGTVWWFIAMKPKTVEFLPPTDAPVPTRVRATELSPWEAFEAYLAELSNNPDPTQAIRLAFAYAERGMGQLTARDPEQTPYEWHDQVAAQHSEIAVLLWPLTERYSSIRFGNHVATADERDRAIKELRLIAHRACA